MKVITPLRAPYSINARVNNHTCAPTSNSSNGSDGSGARATKPQRMTDTRRPSTFDDSPADLYPPDQSSEPHRYRCRQPALAEQREMNGERGEGRHVEGESHAS